MLRTTHGLCGTTGISTGGKKSSRKCPRSESFHAKPSWCTHMKWCMRSRSAGHRKSSGCALSMISFRSRVYLPVGSNGGGLGSNLGRVSRGSPEIVRTIRNRSGRSVNSGRTFWATGLYFFFPARRVASGVRVRGKTSTGSKGESMSDNENRGRIDAKGLETGELIKILHNLAEVLVFEVVVVGTNR